MPIMDVEASKPSERAESLARRFERACSAFLETADSLNDAQWMLFCPEEQCTVAALVHHVASAMPFELRAFAPIARGEMTEPITWAFLAEVNAKDAEANATCDRTQTLELFRDNAQAATSILSGFSDEELQRRGHYVEDAPALTLDQWIRHAMIGHITNHLASLNSVIGHS